MITTTHVTVNWLLAGRMRGRPLLSSSTRRTLFVVGGLAPDVPLILLWMGATAFYWIRPSQDASAHLMNERLLDTSPWWIAAYNVLHAPLILVALYLVGLTVRHRWGPLVQSFAAGCLLHTALDIPVHHSNGPLLLFPFDWTIRFDSPVSYWNPAHYGVWIQPIDLGVTLLGAVLLGWTVLRRRRDSRRPADWHNGQRERRPGS